MLLSASMNSNTNQPSLTKLLSRSTSLQQDRLSKFTVGLTMIHIHFLLPNNILVRLSASARDLSTEDFKKALNRSLLQKTKGKKMNLAISPGHSAELPSKSSIDTILQWRYAFINFSSASKNKTLNRQVGCLPNPPSEDSRHQQFKMKMNQINSL